MLEYGSDALPPRPKTARQRAAEQAALTEEEKRKKRCCFAGHHPQNLSRPVDDVKIDLENEILAAIRDGYSTFITGMGYGTDIWAGAIVVRLKDRFPDLKLIAAVPFPEFPEKWDRAWKARYEQLLGAADLVRFICPKPCEEAFRLRNQWMVDHSSRMIAVYNGKTNETGNSLRYARKNSLQIHCLPAVEKPE